MKHNWEYKSFGDVGTFVRGTGLTKKDFVENGHPCIHYGQIHTKFGTYTKKHLTCIPEELVSTAKIAHPGDVIMAITSEDVEGSCKTTAWLGDYDIAVGAHTAIFHHTLNSVYISYYTRSKTFFYEKARYAKGFKVKEISPKEIALISIPVPPFAVQQQIVSELDCINDLISTKREQLSALDELEQSLFYEMFGDPVENPKGWIQTTYNSELIISSGGTPSKQNPEYWQNGTIPWIGSNMCHNSIIYKTDGKTITEKGLENSSAKIYPIGTILIALVGATIGKVGLLAIPTSTNQNIAGLVIQNTERLNSLYVFFHSRGLYPLFENFGAGKFAISNQKFIKNLPLMLPPISLQNQFAQRIEAIEEQKRGCEASVAGLQILLDSRMDYWFND